MTKEELLKRAAAAVAKKEAYEKEAKEVELSKQQSALRTISLHYSKAQDIVDIYKASKTVVKFSNCEINGVGDDKVTLNKVHKNSDLEIVFATMVDKKLTFYTITDGIKKYYWANPSLGWRSYYIDEKDLCKELSSEKLELWLKKYIEFENKFFKEADEQLPKPITLQKEQFKEELKKNINHWNISNEDFLKIIQCLANDNNLHFDFSDYWEIEGTWFRIGNVGIYLEYDIQDSSFDICLSEYYDEDNWDNCDCVVIDNHDFSKVLLFDVDYLTDLLYDKYVKIANLH